ncbi:MAG TPA: hypothetical protein DCO79_15215, partial [Spirochaeta sp.]|nr:hypothetical protein [Spirochaeta sp.]
HGYLHRSTGGFNRDEVETLLEKIRSGEIDRLNKRANKRETSGTLLPDTAHTKICNRLCSIDLEPAEIIWFTAIALFRLHGLTEDKPVSQLAELHPSDFINPAAYKLLSERFNELSMDTQAADFIDSARLIDAIELPKLKPSDTDIAGIIYQALCRRGSRSAAGSFYTSPKLTETLIDSALQKLPEEPRKHTFIDPCCGSGQFILSFIKAGGSPGKAIGIDSDAAAAFTAGVNILLQCPDYDSAPMIFTADSLLSELPEAAGKIGPFDLAVTNPPWGAATAGMRKALAERYPAVSSSESFSFFISRCLELVKPEGVISLVLPESVTNVNRHKDIRQHILEQSRISRIDDRGRAFSNVFTPVVTMELIKSDANKKSSPDADSGKNCFNINMSAEDTAIIDSIYNLPHTSLEGRAEWALGIVTGNNARFISDRQTEGFEPIIRGSDIAPGQITGPSSFIRFEPEQFQQSAPEWKYRTAEKLVYRFISKHLKFAVDPDGLLTLNSANIIIPGEELIKSGWGAEQLAALFNSDIYNFIFRKKFNSLKVLRGHLEQLPLPVLSKSRAHDDASLGLSDRQIAHIKNSL